MPPASSPGLLDRPNRITTAAPDRAAKVRFRRAITLMLMTLFVPGSAQLVAGNRTVGKIALRVWLTLVFAGLAAFLLGLVWHGFAFWLVANTGMLGLIRITLMLAAIGWAALFMDAWRLGQPLTLRQNHRLTVVGVNGVLCFTVVGALLFSAHVIGVQREFITTTFGEGQATAATHGRYNVLLMGGDSGAGRWGLRPDSMTIASIDADSGETVLFGLPRNMANFPFAKGSVMEEQFPDGFDCEGCYLNGVSTWAGDNVDLFKGSDNPGVDATIMGIEGITGLKINYWAMVNLKGFEDLVDAVGGVKLNVRDRIPVGGLGSDVTGYIEPGRKKLNGRNALWFARAREGSDDYSRMARQKCVMNALVTQISPQVAVRNFEKITKASSAMISTNLPASELDTFMDLSIKAKSQKISTVSFVPPMINTARPDIDLIQGKVDAAIAKAEGKKADKPATAGKKAKLKKKQQDQQVTGGSVGSLSDGYAANESDDLGSAC